MRTASAILPSVELRNEAIAALRSPDLETEVAWDLPDSARGFAFDPELEHYVIRSDPAVPSMFRLRDNAPVRNYVRPPEVPAECAALDYQFSATGKYLAVRYENGPVVLFARETAAAVCVLGRQHVYLLDAVSGATNHTALAPATVRTLDWDLRGERLAFGCSNATLFLLESASGRMLQFGGRTVQPWAQRFSEDGSLLLTSGRDGLTSLWDVNAAKLLCQSTEARGVVFARRGDRIGWGIPRKQIGVWRVSQPSSDTPLQGRRVNGATLWQQDFSPDGRRVFR